MSRVFPGSMNAVRARKGIERARPQDAFSDPETVLDQLLAHDVVSFDLFDTIVRRAIPVEAVHRKTAEFAASYLRGDDGPLPEGLLVAARHGLQDEVKRRSAVKGRRNEVRLADVFNAALAPHMRDPRRRATVVKALLAHEVATEIAVLDVDPRMRAVIEKLRLAGKRVILLSDMYFEAPEMERILQALDLWRLFDAVFVSATEGVTKASGLLFRRVASKLGLVPERCIHLGDNGHSDVAMARAQGWHALHFHDPLREAERLRRELDLASGPMATRAALRETVEDFCGQPEPGMMQLTAAAFSGFARAVLSEAVQERHDRVLFLTRDGTRFLHVARDWLAELPGAGAMQLPPMQELAVSRRMGQILSYPGRDDPRWHGWLAYSVQWLNHTPLSIRTIMRTFGLSTGDLTGLAPARAPEVAGYLDGDDPATDLGFTELLKRPDLLDPLDAALRAKQARVMAYLDEARLFDSDERLLLVDLGYSGTLAKQLSEQMWLREARGRPVASRITLMMLAANQYHRGNLRRMHPRIRMKDGTIIRTDRWQDRAAAANFAWLEPFAVDRTRGSLRDYAAGPDGRMVPVFGPAEHETADDPVAQAGHNARQEAAMQLAIGAYHAALRRSAVPEAEVDRHMQSLWKQRVIRPDSEAVAAVAARAHHAGCTDLRLDTALGRVRATCLVSDIAHCVKDDRWVQGSLRASGLRLLTPFINPILASELQ